MSSDRWERVKRIFEAILDRPAREWDDYLGEACGTDRELRAEVERLLAQDAEAGDFLEKPVLQGPPLFSGITLAPRTFEEGDLVGGRFDIVRFVGKGGMGEVYEAVDRAIGGVRIALKTIRPEMAKNEHLTARFHKEVVLARAVTHPNVCRIYDLFRFPVDSGGGAPREVTFLTMELLRGQTLAERLRQRGPFSQADAEPLVRQIADALDAAHRAGIVHRDFKSSNVMLVPSRDSGLRAVVTDFGLAHSADPAAEETQEHPLFGTPEYMAPEQFAGAEPTYATDVFAFGVVLYEMLTGRRPFVRASGQPAGEVCEKPDSPRVFAPRLETVWDQTILKCLEPDPKKRFQSAREVIAALDRPRLVRRRMLMVGATTLLAAASVWTLEREVIEPMRRDTRASIAVLPLTESSAESGPAYFADGVTEEIIQALTKMPGLLVSARMSVFQFKGKDLSPAEIASRLHVKTLLTGTVRRDGGRVRVSVQLVDAENGFQLWAENYDRQERDALRIQDEIARSVAQSLKLSFASMQAGPAGRGGTTNVEAHHFYLRGLHHAVRRGDDALKESIHQYEQAVARDPRYALAWAALADSHNMLAGRPGYPIGPSYQRARDAASRALTIDSSLAEAHVSLAFIRERHDWDGDGAERHFRTAVSLSPGLAVAHHRYAGFLSDRGRHAEALEEIRKARELDPLSLPINTAYGAFLHRARRHDEAIAQLELARGLDPEYIMAFAILARAYAAKGRANDAVSLMETAVKLSGGGPLYLGHLAFFSARAGRIEQARAIVAELQRRWPVERFSPSFIARAWLGLDDRDQVFHWLDVARKERDPVLTTLNVEPDHDLIRSDPRFIRIVKELRLE